jgi:MFS family permease
MRWFVANSGVSRGFERELRIKGSDDRKWWVQIGVISAVGITMAIALMGSLLLGVLVDRYLGTRVFFWVGLFVGLLAAARSFWMVYDRYLRDDKQGK